MTNAINPIVNMTWTIELNCEFKILNKFPMTQFIQNSISPSLRSKNYLQEIHS